MFREEYIKDNELIKPDDDFLRRLKESVRQENEVVHISNYVDYDNAANFEKLGRDDDTIVEMHTKKKSGSGWKRLTMIAACFILIVAFAVGRTGLIGEDRLQAGIESALSEELFTTEAASDLSKECIELYDAVYDLFATCNVVIYEMDSYVQDDNGMKYLMEAKSQYRDLEITERDELVGNILANKYVLTDTTEEWNSITYYLAEFENQTYVVFAMDSDQFICIEDMSGIQKMACN